ncbi:hypothetical protein AB9E09_09460 [Rhizobium leguminosarum]|uniref:hypothetical protein n=1 Tax=Rhizobium leguminosarum TaxID=384 RepID=UPI003F9E5899
MPIDVISVESVDTLSFDLLVCSVGYEERSIFFAERLKLNYKHLIGHVFSGNETHSFANNLKTFEKLGGVRLEEHNNLANIVKSLNPLWKSSGSRVALDISSMSRSIMAKVLSELIDSDYFEGCQIYILYTPAKFTHPSSIVPDFIEFAPIPEFAGWTSAPEKPAVMVIGLGYETDQAIGALEYLDPSATFVFIPVGGDDRFREVLLTANQPLLEMIKPERLIEYSVADPTMTYWHLRSLVSSLIDNTRIVLVPMGPKIFVSLCLACQREFGDEVSVWRSSGHTSTVAKDVASSGIVSSFLIRRSAE